MDTTPQDETNILLKEILKSLNRIEKLLVTQSGQSDQIHQSIEVEEHPLDVMELIDVISKKDEHLLPTIKALFSKDGSSAQDIAIATKRSRSRENQHLNKLVELGYVQKVRDGREIRFFLSQ